jgi:hypothetical protein
MTCEIYHAICANVTKLMSRNTLARFSVNLHLFPSLYGKNNNREKSRKLSGVDIPLLSLLSFSLIKHKLVILLLNSLLNSYILSDLVQMNSQV